MTVGRTRTAALDADFIIHIAEIDRATEDIVGILDDIFDKLDLCTVVHPLVYDKEIDVKNTIIATLFSRNLIRRLAFHNDIFQMNSEKEAYYRYLVPELYKSLKGEAFPANQDVLTYWKRKSSLGEIHSAATCLICQFGLFLSDDGDSKTLKKIIEQRVLGKIDVYNRQEVLGLYDTLGERSLSRADRRAFAHQ